MYEPGLPYFPEWFRFDPAGASPIIAGISVLLCATYLRGAIWMWLQGRRWPPARAIAFVLGCVLTFTVATLGVNRYAGISLTALMFQQITLMTVVPPLLIAGTPGRLLLRSTPHHGIGRIVLRAAHAGLRSRWARAILHPFVPIAIALVLFPGLYLTDYISIVMMTPIGADLLLAVIFISGIVAAVPLWSSDPLPRAPSYPIRLVDIFIEIQIHAVLGLIMVRASSPLISIYADSQQGTDPVYDQTIAGMLLWTYAELPLFAILIVCLSRWHSHDQRKTRLNTVNEDVELEAYNAYLAEIDRKDQY